MNIRYTSFALALLLVGSVFLQPAIAQNARVLGQDKKTVDLSHLGPAERAEKERSMAEPDRPAFKTSASAAQAAAATVTGTIGPETFDRRWAVITDNGCNAGSSDSSNNGVAYDVIHIQTTNVAGENLVATVNQAGTSIFDTVLFLYCNAFDPLQPTNGLVAWDDDGGQGFLSAFTNADGLRIEHGRTYAVAITNWSSGGAGGTYSITFGGDIVVLPPPGTFTVTESGGNTAVTEGGTTDNVTIQLSRAATSNVVIDYSSPSGDIQSGSVTIPAGSQTAQVAIIAQDDSQLEDQEVAQLTFSVNDAQSEDAFDNAADQNINVTVTDNDTVGITITQTDGSTAVSERGTSDTFTVTLLSQPYPPITLDVTSSATDEATVSPAMLNFDASNWNVPQTVTVTGVPDNIDDGTQTATITLAAQLHPTWGYFTQSLDVPVSFSNVAPVATNDNTNTPEDTPLSINVRANDTDADGDPFTVSLTSQPANGTATINESGTPSDPSDDTITYTPSANFHGTNTFTYEIRDAFGAINDATVTIEVTPVNDPPVGQGDTGTTAEDMPLTIDVLANDTDVEGNTLSAAVSEQPANGMVTVASTAAASGSKQATTTNATASLIYTPNANFNGTDTFVYQVSDGNGGTDTSKVTVTVTPSPDAPIAVNDALEADEDTAANLNVLANDSDPDGDMLTLSVTSQPANGTAALNDGGTPADPSDDTVLYTPNTDFEATDTFTYQVSDGNGGTASATVTVTIRPANDPPVATNDNVTTNEDTPASIDVLANDSDRNGDPLTITITSSASKGTAAVDDNGTPGVVTDDKVSYTPQANVHGSDSFTYQIADGRGGTSTATIAVMIAPVNDAPVALPDTARADEDIALKVQVLKNDSDIEGDVLTAMISRKPLHGMAEIDDNDTPMDPSDDLVLYTPATNFNGADSLTYKISDGNGGMDSAWVFVTYDMINDAPDAVEDVVSVAEDGSVTIDVLANDSDPEGDALSFTMVRTPRNGSATVTTAGITYTPRANYHGSDRIDYEVSDGNGGVSTGQVTITVTSVNDAPVARNDEGTSTGGAIMIDVLANDRDIEGDALTLSIITRRVPSAGTPTVDDNGTPSDPTDDKILYTPRAKFSGLDRFYYQIDDGNGGTDDALVIVVVSGEGIAVASAPDVVAAPVPSAPTVTTAATPSVPLGGYAVGTAASIEGTIIGLTANQLVVQTDQHNLEVRLPALAHDEQDTETNLFALFERGHTVSVSGNVGEVDHLRHLEDATVEVTGKAKTLPKPELTTLAALTSNEATFANRRLRIDSLHWVATERIGTTLEGDQAYTLRDDEGLEQTFFVPAGSPLVGAAITDTRVSFTGLLMQVATSDTADSTQATGATYQLVAHETTDLVFGSGEAAEASSDLPQTFALEGNYPNPFNPTTTIRFAVPEAAQVTIQLYDVTGRLVRELVRGAYEAGRHTVRVDATGLSSGLYLYRMEAGAFRSAQTMTVLK